MQIAVSLAQWSEWRDLNPRPTAPKAGILLTSFWQNFKGLRDGHLSYSNQFSL